MFQCTLSIFRLGPISAYCTRLTIQVPTQQRVFYLQFFIYALLQFKAILIYSALITLLLFKLVLFYSFVQPWYICSITRDGTTNLGLRHVKIELENTQKNQISLVFLSRDNGKSSAVYKIYLHSELFWIGGTTVSKVI